MKKTITITTIALVLLASCTKEVSKPTKTPAPDRIRPDKNFYPVKVTIHAK